MPKKQQSRDAPRIKIYQPPRKGKGQMSIYPSHKAILLCLLSRPLTDQELAVETSLYQDTSIRRRRELIAQGFIESCNTSRKTTTGRPARLWRLSKTGLVKARELKKGGQ